MKPAHRVLKGKRTEFQKVEIDFNFHLILWFIYALRNGEICRHDWTHLKQPTSFYYWRRCTGVVSETMDSGFSKRIVEAQEISIYHIVTLHQLSAAFKVESCWWYPACPNPPHIATFAALNECQGRGSGPLLLYRQSANLKRWYSDCSNVFLMSTRLPYPSCVWSSQKNSLSTAYSTMLTSPVACSLDYRCLGWSGIWHVCRLDVTGHACHSC